MTSRLVPPPHQHPAVPARPDSERVKPETPSRRTLVIAAAGAACSAWGWGAAEYPYDAARRIDRC